MLVDILKVFKSDIHIDEKNLKEQTKKFKMCKEHSAFASDFENPAERHNLSLKIQNQYEKLINETSKVIETNIDTNADTRKDVLLVKAILEVIDNDNSIDERQRFYILPNGKSVNKKQLRTMKEFYLPSFLLGVLYYVLYNIRDNTEGFNTYNLWCPQLRISKRLKREYSAMIGENSKKKIKLIRSIDEFDYNNISIPDDELITAYVKLSSKEYYNITSSSIIVTDTIDDEEKDSYKCLQVPYDDCSLLDSFIDDFNDFTSFIKKHRSDTNNDSSTILFKLHNAFYYYWYPQLDRIKGNQVKEWVDYIIGAVLQLGTCFNRKVDIPSKCKNKHK